MSDNFKPTDNSQDQQIRHNLVNTATSFLLNKSVVDKPQEHKTAFLRKKGLTDAEIALAYEKAESDPKSKQVSTDTYRNNLAVLPPPISVYNRPVSFWAKLSKISSSLIILGVAVFGAHYVYKKYIEPLIFGEDKDKKSEQLQKQLQEMMNSLAQVEKHVSALEESINSQKEQMDRFLQNEFNEYCPTPVALRELKSEVASVKSLFLNKNQFPAVPQVSPLTIPKWQRPSDDSDVTIQDDEENQNTDQANSVAAPCNGVKSQEDDDSAEIEHNSEAGDVPPTTETKSLVV